MNWQPQKDSKADVSSVSPLSERISDKWPTLETTLETSAFQSSLRWSVDKIKLSIYVLVDLQADQNTTILVKIHSDNEFQPLISRSICTQHGHICSPHLEWLRRSSGTTDLPQQKLTTGIWYSKLRIHNQHYSTTNSRFGTDLCNYLKALVCFLDMI